MMGFVILISDAAFWIGLLFVVFLWIRMHPTTKNCINRAFNAHRSSGFCMVIVMVFVLIAAVDSIHFYASIDQKKQGSNQVISMLDELFSASAFVSEVTYSAPLATHDLTKRNGIEHAVNKYAKWPLKHIDQQVLEPGFSKMRDITYRIIKAISMVFMLIVILALYHQRSTPIRQWRFANLQMYCKQLTHGQQGFYMGLVLMILLICLIYQLSMGYHLMGTDKVGHDVWYLGIKSIRTGILLGSITLLIALPIAIMLGISAGYFGGRVDDLIQMIYITLSSIPGVLLIGACVLSLDIWLGRHQSWFSTLTERSDARLMLLALILALTSWPGLCRMLRGEAMKLRTIDFVRAAKMMGMGRMTIIMRHILPNVMHVVLITALLDFSGLVLAEAVLSYVGIGVDPSMISWGNMIMGARFELSGSPVVWWPLFTAFLLMSSLVVAVNILGDVLQQALDPRSHHTLG